MEIEEVAKTDPDSIIVEPINIAKGISEKTLDKAVKTLGLESVANDAKD